MRTRPLHFIFAVLLALLLVFAIHRLYVLRFEVGDVYPPYSSLRADPLGTKVLFAALEDLPDLQVARAFRDPEPPGREARRTILLLGVPADLRVTSPDIHQLKGLAASGDRIVIAFLPVREVPKKNEASSSPTPAPDSEEEEEPTMETSALAEAMEEEFGCGFGYSELREKAKWEATALTEKVEPAIPLNSILHFTPAAPQWETLYALEGKPVVIERRYGGGSIVLLSDVYLFSNEALRRHLSPRFLARVMGDARLVLFDETLHGLRENTNVAGLLRKYQLEPFLLFAGFLAALFAWQIMSPLVPIPPSSHVPVESEVAGRDALAGRINLLRRSIPSSELIPQCLRRWEHSAGRRLAHRPQLLARIRAQASAKAPPSLLYQNITATLENDRHLS